MMRRNGMALRVLSTATFLAMVASCVTPAFAGTYNLSDAKYKNGIVVKASEDGNVYVKSADEDDSAYVKDEGELVITGDNTKTTSETKQTAQQDLTEENETSPVEKAEDDSENTPASEDEQEGASPETEENTPESEPTEDAEDGDTAQDAAKEGGTQEGGGEQNEQPEQPEDEPEEQQPAQPEADADKADTQQGKDAAPAVDTQVDDSQNSKAADTGLKSVIKIINNWKNKVLDVTLNNVTIDKSTTGTYPNPSGNDIVDYGESAIAVTGSGDTTVHLEGNNVLKSGKGRAALEKNDSESTGKLTITADADDDNHSLTVVGGTRAAGIGGKQGEGTSKLVIDGGKINATGQNCGAAIGGGKYSTGEITINGGDITVNGGDYASGIGGGSNGGTGKVTITGGKITASSKGGGTAIGGGSTKAGSADILITGGEINIVGSARVNTTGIGGSATCTEKTTIRILGGKVNAVGTGNAAGIGAGTGDAQVAEIEIGGDAQVTAKGGDYNESKGAGAAIGTAGGANGVAGQEIDLKPSNTGNGTVIRLDPTSTADADHTHTWTETSHTDAAIGQPGKTDYVCDVEGCGATKTEYTAALEPEVTPDVTENSKDYEPLTVENYASEQTLENDRLIIAVPAQSATLRGSLGALNEYRAKGAKWLVFRTQQKESVLSIDALLSRGSEEDIFVLTHTGDAAALTVAGRSADDLLK